MSAAQLDRIIRDAERELRRRKERTPINAVLKALKRGAEAMGYALDEVFPERKRFESSAKPRTLHRGPREVRVKRQSSAPSEAALSTQNSAIADVRRVQAKDLIRTIVASGRAMVGVSVSLNDLGTKLGLRENWNAFHAAMEEANRKGWLHFRGNEFCYLTGEGEAAASAADI